MKNRGIRIPDEIWKQVMDRTRQDRTGELTPSSVIRKILADHFGEKTPLTRTRKKTE